MSSLKEKKGFVIKCVCKIMIILIIIITVDIITIITIIIMLKWQQ